jgi:hypothetical protein
MNNRSRTEKEIIVSLNQNISLEDISLNSSGSRAETDMLLMKLLNKYHLTRKPSSCCPILASSAA